jgi:hypothetical protein
MTAAVTALDAYRHAITTSQFRAGDFPPVGPDVAVGLSSDLFEDTAAAVGWDTAFTMAFALDELGPGECAVIGLAAENAVRGFVDHLPQVGRP